MFALPWGAVLSDPQYLILLPFAWLLWQVYAPAVIDRLTNFSTDNGSDHRYHTAWSALKAEMMSEFDRVDNRVDAIDSNVQRIAETQEDLVNVTVAQSHLLNGTDGEMDVEAVEATLRDDDRDRPTDYVSETDDTDGDA